MATAPCFAVAAPGKSKVVQALIAAAQKEFDAGNFERAGELFLEIYRQDPETRAALYNSARAYQLAGKIDKADELFKELLAIPDLDPGLKGKATNQLELLQTKRGERKADDADRAEKAGQWAAAAGMWAEAIKLVPAKTAWQLRLARALHLAGQAAQAVEAYDKYLAATPESSEDRAQVKAWRDELTRKPEPEPVKPEPVKPEPVRPEPAKPEPAKPEPAKPEKTPTPVIRAPAPAPSRTVPLAVMGGGAALVVVGGVVLGLAAADDSALQEKFAGTGPISGISHTEAQAEAERISRNYAIGWALTGVGVVGAGVGAWLWMSQPQAKVAVLPQPGGLSFAARF
ncbi:MAG: tetratricopeptide repeat protein [Deltaproteobacteria bacterium]|nr:tetratricopeptide repeat protein [Deltaproteobacteria bacterium]